MRYRLPTMAEIPDLQLTTPIIAWPWSDRRPPTGTHSFGLSPCDNVRRHRCSPRASLRQ